MGVKGVTPSKSHRFRPICCLWTILISVLSLVFSIIFLPPWNFRGGDIPLTENFRGAGPPVPLLPLPVLTITILKLCRSWFIVTKNKSKLVTGECVLETTKAQFTYYTGYNQSQKSVECCGIPFI